MPAAATKKTGRQVIEGLNRKAHFPPVHARSMGLRVNPVPISHTMERAADTPIH